MKAHVVLLLLAVSASAAAGQRPQAAVVPATIKVGDVFHAAVRVDLPAGATIAAPDSLGLVDDVEQAGRRELRLDTINGMARATLLYPLAAWRVGEYQLPRVSLRITGASVDSMVVVALPPFEVTSVLPADTAGIEAKPAKDVLGANRLWWPILLALLVAAVIATALYVWWRRRRRAQEPVVFTPAAPPLEVALAELEALRREGLIERGEFRTFYGRLTEALRHYAAAVDERWSVDLTTAELALRLRSDAGMADALELTRILGSADMVKFARASSTADGARQDLDAARAWVERFAPGTASADADQQRAA